MMSSNRLQALLDWLVSPGWRWPRGGELRLTRLPRDQADLRALLRGAAPHCLDLTFADGLILSRTHELPAKGRAQAGKVLALQLKRLSPTGGDDFLAGARRTRSQGGLDTHLQIVARRSDVDHVVTLARTDGMTVRQVRAEAEGVSVLLLDRRAEANRDVRAWWGLGLIAAGIALALTSLQATREMQGARTAMQAARAELAQLQGEAEEVVRGRDAAGAANATLAADAALFADDAHALSRLVDLTTTVPDSAWVSNLSLERGQVSLQGSSSDDASDLVGRLDALPWVARVELTQPLLSDPAAGITTFEFRLVTQEPAP